MTIIALLFWIALIGVIAWLLVTYIPMVQPIKTVIVIVAVICVVLIAAHAFGIVGDFNVQVPKVR